ncbi:MAG: HAD-IA family hydrolase [Polyangia bacterium]|jgi:putative hydrolase of the HAD superfamily|nr:HAD-IA family hydrolase [Polyangia bacterium]
MSETSSSLGRPAPERIHAVLFDAGQTLIRPSSPVEQIYALHARPGRPVTPELREEVRRSFRALFDAERQRMASGADDYAASDEADYALWKRLCYAVAERVPGLTDDPQSWFETLYAEFGRPETWQVFSDTWPTLRVLAERGIVLGVVSNWDSRLQGILEGLGLAAPMRVILISAREGARKPGPRIFSMALDALGLAPEHVLMVGDSVTDDVEGAWGSGLHGVLIHRSPRAEPPPGIPAVRSLTELLAWPCLAGSR